MMFKGLLHNSQWSVISLARVMQRVLANIHDTGSWKFFQRAISGAAGLSALSLQSLAAGIETLPFGHGLRALKEQAVLVLRQ